MQSVIVYRNPVEAAFWDMFMSSPNTFPVMVSIVVFFVTLLCCTPLVERIQRKNWRAKWPGYALVAVSVGAAIATFNYMAI